MDTLVAAVWDVLGPLWRVALIASPIAFILWALVRVRRVEADAVERRKRDVESRNDPPASPISRGL